MSSSCNFLSGEADSKVQSQREKRISSLVINSGGENFTDGSSSSSSSRTASKTTNNLAGNARKVGIQVLDEETFTRQVGDDSCKFDNHESDPLDNDDDEPPPISLMDATAKAVEDLSVSNDRFSNDAKKDKEEPSLMEQMMAEACKAREHKKKIDEEKERKSSKTCSFGMKKGFLTSSSGKTKKNKNKKNGKLTVPRGETTSTLQKGFLNSTTKNTRKAPPSRSERISNQPPSENDLIYELDSEGNIVKPSFRDQDTEKSETARIDKNSLKLNEVQEAMKDPLERLLSSTDEWAKKPDFIEKVAQNQKLMEGLSNPKFVSALKALQTNPKEAMKRFQKDHPDVIEFLNEYCSVLGDQFIQLGEKQDKEEEKEKMKHAPSMGPLAKEAWKKEEERRKKNKKGKEADLEDGMSRDEKKKLDSILADQELTTMLMDPAMQRIMQECAHPGRMQAYLHDPEYGPKLKKMIHAGLLQLA